jgi:hypothetical protein
MGLKNDESFQKKCRLCGRPGRRFTDIFTPKLQSAETKPNRKLSQLIYKCLQLQVSMHVYVFLIVASVGICVHERLKISEKKACSSRDLKMWAIL